MSELIDKQSVLNVLEDMHTLTVNGVEKRSAVYGLIDGYTGMIRCKVNQLPVIQPKRGRWMSLPHKRARICSWCEHDEPYKFADDDAPIFNYGPYCGAKMDEVTT